MATTDGCLVSFYHYVRDSETTAFPALKALAIADFEWQLSWLAERARVVTCDELVDAFDARRPLDATALLTFDDGLVDHWTAVTPRLRARGWRGVFFLAGAALEPESRLLNVHRVHFLLASLGADRFAAEIRARLAESVPLARSSPGRGGRLEAAPVERSTAAPRDAAVYRYDAATDLDVKHLLNYELPFDETDRLLEAMFARHFHDEVAFARRLYLSPDQIARMADAGMTFGFHTERHRVLSRLDRSAQEDELARGVERIRALTGQRRVPFCYPYGHRHTYDDATLALLDSHGFSCAFTTARRHARPELDSRFEIPRFDTRDLPPFAAAVRAASTTSPYA